MLSLVSFPINALAKPKQRCKLNPIFIESKSNSRNSSFLDHLCSEYNSAKFFPICRENTFPNSIDFAWDSDDNLSFPTNQEEYVNLDEINNIRLPQEIDIELEPCLMEDYVHFVQLHGFNSVILFHKIEWNLIVVNNLNKIAIESLTIEIDHNFNSISLDNNSDEPIFLEYQRLCQEEIKYESKYYPLQFNADIPESLKIEDVSIANEPCFNIEEITGELFSNSVILTIQTLWGINYNWFTMYQIPEDSQYSTVGTILYQENFDNLLMEIFDQTKVSDETCPRNNERQAYLEFLDLEVIVDGPSGIFHNHEESTFDCWGEIPWPKEISSCDAFRSLQREYFMELFPTFFVDYVYNDLNWSKQYIKTSRDIRSPRELSVMERPLNWILKNYWPVVSEKMTFNYSIRIINTKISLPTPIHDDARVQKEFIALNEFIAAALEKPTENIANDEQWDISKERLATHDKGDTNNLVTTASSSSKLPSTSTVRIKPQPGNITTPDFQGLLLKMDNDLNTTTDLNASLTTPPSTIMSPKKAIERNIVETIPDIHGEQNHVIIMSENIFEKYFSFIPQLQSHYNMTCIDYPFRDAADIVVSEITCIKLVEDINMLKVEQFKRDLIKALCNLTTKFSLIWLLVNTTHQQYDALAESIVGLSQSFMRFPSRVIIRYYTDTTLSDVIASVYHDDVAVSQRDPRLLSQYYNRRYCLALIESPEISATCDFLQQYPSINVYLAALLVISFSSLEEIVQATPEEMKQRLQKICPMTKMEYLMPNFVTLAILLRCKVL